MSLLEDLMSSLPDCGGGVQGVTVGTRWTLVASSHCGLAYIHGKPDAIEAPPSSSFSGKALKDLIPLASSTDPVDASLGVAALNAALQDAMDTARFQPYSIPRAGGKVVGVLGEFAFTEQLRTLADEVIVAEPELAEQVLTRADIAIISGSYVVEHSLESLLKASASCYTIVFGPSTPLSPVLFDYGADQLVGVKIEDHEEAARCVTTGLPHMMECPGLRPVVMTKRDT
jgi:uncharacterized protein (DUF4213/DUF364 family)